MRRLILVGILVAVATTMKAYSLTSACEKDLSELCDLRNPWSKKAVSCLSAAAAKGTLSEQCKVYHKGRVKCTREIQKANYSACEPCRAHCKGVSVFQCARIRREDLLSIGVTDACLNNEFFQSVLRTNRISESNL